MALPVSKGEFEFPDRFWFVVPDPEPRDFTECCESMPNTIATIGKREGTAIAAFTDEDLAWRFIRGIENPPCDYMPRLIEVKRDAALFLQQLVDLGENAVFFDPEPASHPNRLWSIEEVLNGVLRWPN